MNNTIEVLKKWCLEQKELTIYDFKYRYSANSEDKIILYFYSLLLEESTCYIFFLNKKDYLKNKINYENNYLLPTILSKIRMDKINKILND